MDELLRATLLALLQGLTEFLPISSSAHLILPARLFGWEDQGLVFDVAVHLGTLGAVIVYFRHTLRELALGCAAGLGERRWNDELSMVNCLAIATVPVAIAGLLAGDFIESELRSLPVIATTTIMFGLLLAWADIQGQGGAQLNARRALWIGLAQMLALVPGTSRSGITITAALFCGMDRESSARFSFLLSIPVILAAASLKSLELSLSGQVIDWWLLSLAVIVSGVTAFLTIRWFLGLVQRLGFMPFVIYRCVLGLVLIYVWMG